MQLYGSRLYGFLFCMYRALVVLIVARSWGELSLGRVG